MVNAGIERRAFETDTHSRIMDIESQLEVGHERMERIEKKLDEVYDILSTAKGFFKVLDVIGKGVKWLMMVAAFCSAVYAAITHRW